MRRLADAGRAQAVAQVKGLFFRAVGDGSVAICPPLFVTPDTMLFERLGMVLRRLGE